MKFITKLCLTAIATTLSMSAFANVLGTTSCRVNSACPFNVEGSKLGGHDQTVIINGIQPGQTYVCKLSVAGKSASDISILSFSFNPTSITATITHNFGPEIGPLTIYATKATTVGQLTFDAHSNRYSWQTNDVTLSCKLV